jgi:diaminopropionate ammonia-lyase
VHDRVYAELSAEAQFFEHFHSQLGGSRDTYPRDLQRLLNGAETTQARQVLESLSDYAPTPLRALPVLADTIGIAQLRIKDESGRLGLRAFKGVGGIYALYRLLRLRADAMGLGALSAADLLARRHADLSASVTVACATTGNHGRSVARAAQMFGCRCVIYVPTTTTQGRIDALQALGAHVVRIPANYDAAVAQVERDAARKGWFIVSDTAYPGQEQTPRDVMHGYRVIVDEVIRQIGTALPPTHVFVQCGVGGIAGAFCSHFWEIWGRDRPRFIVVESRHAACMLESARAGQMCTIEGELGTRMYGLASGKPSSLAWEVLRAGADDFVSIDDAAALHAMKLLAYPRGADPPIVAGEAGAAGIGALLVAVASAERRAALGLDGSSRVLSIVTEGATDPATYAELVGETAEQVLERQRVAGAAADADAGAPR